MTPTKILIGQILITFFVVFGTLWAATEWAAFMLGFQARLGTPWFSILGYPVYYPWRLYEWWYAFEVYAPTVFYKAGGPCGGGRNYGNTRRRDGVPVAGAGKGPGDNLWLCPLGG